MRKYFYTQESDVIREVVQDDLSLHLYYDSAKEQGITMLESFFVVYRENGKIEDTEVFFDQEEAELLFEEWKKERFSEV